MSNETERKFPPISELLKTIVEQKKTPSERIVKFAIERDKTYDRIKDLEKEIEESKANNECHYFLSEQLKSLTDYKRLLGGQIKKLVDET